MVKVVWTELALGDLKAIHDYISLDSKTYADKFVQKLIGRVDQLESFPRSGRIVPEYNLESTRESIEGNYRIVYRVYADSIWYCPDTSLCPTTKCEVTDSLSTRKYKP